MFGKHQKSHQRSFVRFGFGQQHLTTLGVTSTASPSALFFQTKTKTKKNCKFIPTSPIEDRQGTVAKFFKNILKANQNYELECYLKYSQCFLFEHTVLTNVTKYKNL
jgi:hypothetical protein